MGPEPKASLDMVYKDLSIPGIQRNIQSIMDENGCIIGIIDYIPYKYGKNGDYCYISLIMIKS